MKTLLFLNDQEGSQTGIEDGFTYLQSNGMIDSLKWFYYNDFSGKTSSNQCILKMIEIASEFLPELIVFFHISNFPVKDRFILILKNLSSKPIIVYDEGDMYGGWSKPVTASMKVMFRLSDIVSIRGLGHWYETVKMYNNNVIYTPHSNSLLRWTRNIVPVEFKCDKLVFIGNRVRSRLGNLRRLPGARGREDFVKNICKYFPKEFKLYGQGWTGFPGDQGRIGFREQADVCVKSILQVSYEHYPNIPYYFSDRLPIALASGQIYVCHYHQGYENIFKGCDFIYFFNSTKEAIDIIKYILSLDSSALYQKSVHAKIFADSMLSPEIIWPNLLKNIYSVKEVYTISTGK